MMSIMARVLSSPQRVCGDRGRMNDTIGQRGIGLAHV